MTIAKKKDISKLLKILESIPLDTKVSLQTGYRGGFENQHQIGKNYRDAAMCIRQLAQQVKKLKAEWDATP